MADTAVLGTVHGDLIGRAYRGYAAIGQDGTTRLVLAVLLGAAAIFLAATVLSAWLRLSDPPEPRLRMVLQGIRALALIVVFTALAEQIVTRGPAAGADRSVLDWMTTHRSAMITGPAIAITDAGGPVGTVVLAVVVGVLLARRARSWTPMIVLIGTVGAASAACAAVKALVGRGRPPIATQVLLETDHSFPSGHVTGTIALFGMIAVLLGYGRPAARRWALVLLAGAVTVVVAATRLYLGEHWLTDVVGGAVLGGIAVLAGSAVHAELMRRAHNNAALDAGAGTDVDTGRSGSTHETTTLGRAA